MLFTLLGAWDYGGASQLLALGAPGSGPVETHGSADGRAPCRSFLLAQPLALVALHIIKPFVCLLRNYYQVPSGSG